MNFNQPMFPYFPAPQQVDLNQFKQFLPSLTDETIKQLAIQARQQGMSPQQIADGINFINSLRNTP